MKPSYEELEAKLATTASKLVATETKLAAAEKRIEEFRQLLTKALEKIAELEERLNLNSQNSSKPPSTDRKGNTPDKKKKKRKPRKGYSRPSFPPERVDHQVECSREVCNHCGCCSLELLNLAPKILQQVELPEVRAIVTEYLLKQYCCKGCGAHCDGELPPGIPNSSFGPKLMGTFTVLTGVLHVGKRDAIQFIKDLYDIDIGLGSSSNIEERVANALEPVCQRIHDVVIGGKFPKHFDETGWRTWGKTRFVWVASCEVAAYFRIDPSRSRAAFERLIKCKPEMLQEVVTDRYAVYATVGKLHQYCLAHLIRDFERFAQRESPDKPIGTALAKELSKACRIHGRYKKGKISNQERNRRLGHLKRRVKFWLDEGFANGSDSLSSLCDTLLNNFDKLWTFTVVDGMEPTNNLGERDLRKLVVWRKKSYGTKSERGEKFVCNITSVAETLRRHSLNILKFIQQAVIAHYCAEPPPHICKAQGL